MTPQDLARRCLLFQRFSQIAIAFLQFLEQPHVLDGDHRLVGEGFEKRDLLVRERTNLGSTNDDHADRNTLAQQGRGKYGATTHTLVSAERLWKLGLQQRPIKSSNVN